MKFIFDYKFRFYKSKTNEICLHCHWLYFFSIIISFGQGHVIKILLIHKGMKGVDWCKSGNVPNLPVFQWLRMQMWLQMPSVLWFVSSTFWIVQILVHSHFDLVSSVLALHATKLVSESVAQMALKLINNHLISIPQKT